MLKEGALRKKLQEIGIPNWGSKDLLKRRHIEWLNIYNSNCDADESVRKSKRQLKQELDEWENTQGGKADSKESKIMKKDFDGNGHAKSHKTDFDDLIAKARAKRTVPKPEGGEPASTIDPGANDTPANDPQTKGPVTTEPESVTPPQQKSPEPPTIVPNHEINPQRPYENNESALSTIRAKVAAANETGSTLATISRDPSLPDNEPPSGQKEGIRNPLGSPARKVPMFAVPEQPVRDMDSTEAVQ
jgi:E3 ubiquitin-protein ligase RAD18